MRVAIQTLGCKLNQAETESLSLELARAGHDLVTDVSEADVYVLNTCTVTATADAKSRQALRRAHRANPQARIVAVGCYARRDPARVAATPGVSAIVGSGEEHLSALLDRLSPGADPTGRYPCAESKLWHMASLRTRAFVKVQEGCSGACAYCIVPSVRGSEQSVTADRVLKQIKQRENEGVKEIILTGTRIGAYSAAGIDLERLVRMTLSETSVPRIRLSSLQPDEITPGLLALWQDTRLCPHFHLSLQSGCSATLRRMRRRYSIAGYAQSLLMARRMVPDVAITTDVIVGFPGETDAEFEESYQTCSELAFARIHVFPYSARPGTEAACLAGAVPEQVKKERTRKMLTLAKRSSFAFIRSIERKTRPVLWEGRDDAGKWTGLTDNYVQVKTTSSEDLANRIEDFVLEREADTRG